MSNESLFVRACRGEEVERTPVWLMRQAGRFQPEYREIRSKVSFLELCHKPELAAEVTLFAADSLKVDAAILFADILLIIECLGLQLAFNKGEGPSVEPPIRAPEHVDALTRVDADRLSYVYDAVRLIRRDLPKSKALIGFAGAPFTVASYCIEGGSSREFLHTKQFMLRHPAAWDKLMRILAEGTITYLQHQIDAGADSIQLFDSWAGCLSPQAYRKYVMPYSKMIFEALPAHVVKIHFGRGTGFFLEDLKSAGADVVGIDFVTPLPYARQVLGTTCLQGNFDPAVLLTDKALIRAAVQEVLDGARGGAHVFNLGHGIVPPTPVENVQYLVECVAELSAR